MNLLSAIVSVVVLGTLARGLKTLTLENFEHDTQAATGQTTGVW